MSCEPELFEDAFDPRRLNVEEGFVISPRSVICVHSRILQASAHCGVAVIFSISAIIALR